MLRILASHYLSKKNKMVIKKYYRKLTKFFANSMLSYNGEKLKANLRKMGIAETDTLLVHANFKRESGFKGTPLDVVNALIELVGLKGNLLMVSIPFRGTAYEYLKKQKPFHINKTMSMMGLITEMFRRKKGVMRSFHPTHPVLAYGKDNEWITSDHEKCIFPCGLGTPFDKFRKLKGKILFYDVDFDAITFYHYVEELTKDRLPFGIFHDVIFSVKAYDCDDNEHIVKTYAYNTGIVRNAMKLKDEMQKMKMIKTRRIGNSKCILVNAEDVVTCQTMMVEEGNFPCDL